MSDTQGNLTPADPIPGFYEFVKRRAEAVQSGENPNAADVALVALVAGEALFSDGRTMVCLLSQGTSADVALWRLFGIS